MYYLGKDFGTEGWVLEPFETLDKIKEQILSGQTFGQKFKVFKEIELELKDEDKENSP